MAFNIASSDFRGLVILLYKGLLLRKRHYIVTAFEVIFPVLLVSIPAIALSESSKPGQATLVALVGGGRVTWVNATTYPAFDPLKSGDPNSNYDVLFAYAPSNDVTDKLMHKSIKIWSQFHHNKVIKQGLTDMDELESYCMSETLLKSGNKIAVGTLFNNMNSDVRKLPPNLDYTIRIDPKGLDPNAFRTNLKYQFYRSNSNEYADTYFLSWQASVEKAFIQAKMREKNIKIDYDLWLQRFPFPGHKHMSNGMTVGFLIAVLMVYGFIFFIINIVHRVIEEKSNGSKELLKMMGMTDFIYWFSTFLNYFAIAALVVLIIAIVYKAPLKNSFVLLAHSDFFLILILFLLIAASLVLFCLAITTFFNRSVFGIIVIVILYNVAYALLAAFIFPIAKDATYYEIAYRSLSVFAKFCICLIPPGAILTICLVIGVLEMSGEGVTWSNIYSYDSIPDFNVSDVMLSILFSCFLYSMIIWYVDAVWPWQYGDPKPFYFPFTKSYWRRRADENNDEILLNPESEIEDNEFFEDEPVAVSPGVVIKNLSKTFRTGLQTITAVNNVSLNIYSGQITALLGHNGAGKTTTFNILTGLFAPSGGKAFINGWDIFSQTTKARQSLGICPQHNVLYDTLTVEEHLKIYATLKGVKWGELNRECSSILTLLNLVDKKNELAKNLSGGMKRKLSLGIAFIGGSKVLFLDEPTSGMDVEARRAVWDTLLAIRHDRTIVLTTHYMEEADILGDRIAIMVEGEIQCCGSSLFLKNQFGNGYQLHVCKRKNFDIYAIQAILKKFVTVACLESNYGGVARFNLRSNGDSNFGSLFGEIESKKDSLGVNSYGLTVTTMEDVFINVGKLADIKIKEKFSVENEATEIEDMYIESNESKKFQKFGNQFLGLVMKRMHYAKRHWDVLIVQLALPFLIMCLCLFMVNVNSDRNRRASSLKLDVFEVYGETDGFYHSDPSSESVAEKIKGVFQEKKVNAEYVPDSEKFVLSYSSKNRGDYFKRLIVGANVSKLAGTNARKRNISAWYNGFSFHSQPMSLLLLDTAILREISGSGDIKLTNDPLPHVHSSYYDDIMHLVERIFASIFVPFALSFLSASFVLIPIHERATGAKLLQMMTGIHTATYWFSMFIWDFIISIIVSLLLIIPFAIFGHTTFFAPHSEAIGTAILMFLLYCWSSIPFSYLFSLIIKGPNTGFSVIMGVNTIGGIALGAIFSTVLYMSSNWSKYQEVKAFSWILKLIPSFAVSEGFANLFAISYRNSLCESINPTVLKYNCMQQYISEENTILKCCKDKSSNVPSEILDFYAMENNALDRDILFLFLDGIIYFVLLLLFDSFLMKMLVRHVSQSISRFRKVAVNQFANDGSAEDFDVLQEEERLRNNRDKLSHSEALVALDLTKHFKSITAVDRLTFAIYKKECFGLLGVNGAGKTTTFRMLTGDCYPSQGNAYISNCSVISDLTKFQSYLGYCPQFDPLIDRLSAREMITLFARLRGLSGPKMTRYVNALIKMTDLSQCADKPSMVYSGGNKRKLSVALALIGAPPLLLLDEPTAGVDPLSRRKIWKILSLARTHSGAAVILTTHSMEESEALCSRLAIMVNGRFKCLGSIQHLKSKFGQGNLVIKMKKEEHSATPQSINVIKSYIDTNLPGAILKDDHQGILRYHIVEPSLTLSRLFRFMEKMKKTCNIEDYEISDTSLEQVFLALARSQRVVAS